MAVSPTVSSGVVSVTIKSGGQAIPSTCGVISVEVEYAYNRIPTAVIDLMDGDMPNASFPFSDMDTFKPGSEVEISAGYALAETTIFKGIIVKHGIKIQDNGDSFLRLECRDKALKMTAGRKNANYIDKTDSDIITSLIGKYGVSSTVEASSNTHKEVVQYHCTDWDFMLARAEMNGMLVSVHEGTVTVKAPDGSAEADLLVTYGIDIISFSADMDSASQFDSVSAVSWDPASQKIAESTASAVQINPAGNITPKVLSAVLSGTDERIQSGVSLDASVLSTWAKAQQMKNEMSRICGSVSFQGSSLAKVGSVIELAGVGARFSGKVILSGVRHNIENGEWITEAQFGLSPEWFAESHAVSSPDASALCGAVSGLQIGVVKKLDGDPASEYRIQLTMPLMKAETDGVWARLANFYGTSSAGSFFIPEVGDEVVVGYVNSDPSHPVVLGSLYSSKHKSPNELTAENNTKSIVTKNKLTIAFDEEKKSISITTPGKNEIVISDDEKSITIKDQNQNSVKLNDSGIVLDSPKDIKISSKGAVSITAVSALTLESKADVKIKGLNIAGEAQVGFSAKGTATCELSASGQTVVKGAMVMIN